jgi:hypothetical protein
MAMLFFDRPKLPVNRFIITGAPAGMQSIYDFFHIVKLNDVVMENPGSSYSSRVTKILQKSDRDLL